MTDTTHTLPLPVDVLQTILTNVGERKLKISYSKSAPLKTVGFFVLYIKLEYNCRFGTRWH